MILTLRNNFNLANVPYRNEREFSEFSKFYRENNLKKYYQFFNRSIFVNRRTHEPYLYMEGRYLPWIEAKKRIFQTEAPKNWKIPHGWKYNSDGLVKKDLIHWNQLEADWKDRIDPKPGRFFIELVSNKKGVFGLSRHCWISLIDDETRVISPGFCGKVLKFLPFRGQKGKLASPDPGNFEDGHKHRTRFEVTKEQYLKVKQRIESDQRNKNLYFNLMTRNCSIYACEILKEIGINIDNREYPTQALIRKLFLNTGITIPETAAKILHYTTQFFRILFTIPLNLFLIALGAFYTDSNIEDLERKHLEDWPAQPKKPFSSLWQVLSGQNLLFGTGWKVTLWQECIEKHRRDKLDCLKKQLTRCTNPFAKERIEQKILAVPYEIPPSMKDVIYNFKPARPAHRD